MRLRPARYRRTRLVISCSPLLRKATRSPRTDEALAAIGRAEPVERHGAGILLGRKIKERAVLSSLRDALTLKRAGRTDSTLAFGGHGVPVARGIDVTQHPDGREG